MDAKDYQKAAQRTMLDKSGVTIDDKELQILWSALGIVGEAGEVSELIKKGILHRHGLDVAKIEKELGDVLWYMTALCTKLGIELASVMEKNIVKLQERYPQGFNSGDSISRVDEKHEHN